MQALIDFIIRNLLALWPIARVYEWEQGMVIRGGRILRELPAGLHWRWWFIDEVKKWPANHIGLDLQTGSIVTSDGEPISVSANISYRMASISTMYRTLWNCEQTLTLIAAGQIASDCATKTWAEIRERRKIEAGLVVSLNEVMMSYGVEVVSIRLTDCIPSKAHRHYHDGRMPT